MAYEQLKNAVNANIKRNGVQAITGNLLNGILNSIINNLGDGYQFKGIVTPESEVSVGDKKVFFIAKSEGEYPNCGGLIATNGELTIFYYDGSSWAKDSVVVGGSADGAVRYDEVQDLNIEQRETARGNIGAVEESFVTNSVAEEKSRAEGVEYDLSNAISAESQRAQGAEFDLSARIDAIVQGKDVRDIVANYEELLAYDTSTLGDNDIVMVLLDSTKSGHTTYYRWHTDTQSWEFIGGLAFTYTKTEIDEKFASLHIVLPAIPADAVAHPEDYQELLERVDTLVRGAGADASFKMPIDGIGNVDITYVKTNPANLYLGVFADDRSELYHIIRTISTPRTYTLQIVEKVFAEKDYVDNLHVLLKPELGEDDVILNAEEIYKQIEGAPEGASFAIEVLGIAYYYPKFRTFTDDEGVKIYTIYFEVTDESFVLEFSFNGSEYVGALASVMQYASKADIEGKQDKTFYATYGVTPYADIVNAFNAKKQVMCRRGNFELTMVRIDDEKGAIFTCNDATSSRSLHCQPNNIWKQDAWIELEDSSLKQSVITESATNYPSSKAVVDYVAENAPTKSELTELSLKVAKLERAIVKDLESTSVTLSAIKNSHYIYGTLTALDLTFGDGEDDAEIDVMFVVGADANIVVNNGRQADMPTPEEGSVMEINAKYYNGEWVVLFAQVA